MISAHLYIDICSRSRRYWLRYVLIAIIIIHLYIVSFTQGIVAAVRGMGGRFLRYNGKMYTDIKVKQAVAKTSQTLRDARNPNKNAFENVMKVKSQKGKEEMSVPVTIDTTQEVDLGKELPQELYANYSYQVLKSLCAQQKAEMDSSNSNVSPGRMPSVTFHKRKGGDDERNTNDDTNESKELPKELYLRYTEQVLQPLHFQEGCHSHSFPTGTDVDAAPQNKRESFISPRDAAISSSSIGVEISKVLENHDTRMSSGKICEELMKDDDVEMISTEQCLEIINCIDIGSIGEAWFLALQLIFRCRACTCNDTISIICDRVTSNLYFLT